MAGGKKFGKSGGGDSGFKSKVVGGSPMSSKMVPKGGKMSGKKGY